MRWVGRAARMGMVRHAHNLYEKAEDGMFSRNCRMNDDVKGRVWAGFVWLLCAR